MHPLSADYINTIAEKYLCHGAGVQIAHDWGVPILGGAFGVDCDEPVSWQLGRDNVYTALITPLAGAGFVVGMGLLRASTLLVPEQIILDDEIYHTHLVYAEGIEVNDETLALDVIANVGPRGHFLAEKHTRQHMRDIWIPALTHPRPSLSGEPLPDLARRAKAEIKRILSEHRPEPLEEITQKELQAIMGAAAQELQI